jgi:DNA-binding NtrC family response regulator
MSAVHRSILVVDDEPAHRQFLGAALGKDYSVTPAATGEEAQQLLKNRSFDLVLTDQKMPGISGIDLLKWIKENSPETPVILLTAFGTIDTAVAAVKLGAEDYLTKPVGSPEELRLKVVRSLRKRTLIDQEIIHQEEKEAEFPPDIIAESVQMRKVLELASQVSSQPTTVLLTGESGTGKEVVARFIHRLSDRSEEPFVAVNCAALTETLLESELFGHEKGAFTGATQARRGRFELAHGGTLFLDEIGEMGQNLQTKLLRVLQERAFERVGGTRLLTVDVRVIAATNRDLKKAMEEKSFREDLFYRLNVFPIETPPLRERRSDIIPLSKYFIAKISKRMGIKSKPMSPEGQQALLSHGWPGNIRELQNAIERSLIVSKSDQIEVTDLPHRSAGMREPSSSAMSLSEIEKVAIMAALDRNDGDRRITARELGISLRTLQYRLKEYGLTQR